MNRWGDPSKLTTPIFTVHRGLKNFKCRFLFIMAMWGIKIGVFKAVKQDTMVRFSLYSLYERKIDIFLIFGQNFGPKV